MTQTISKLAICDDCYQELPFNKAGCKTCSLPLEDGNKCPDCERLNPCFNKVFVPLNYIFPIDQLIHHFKNRDKLHIGKTLTLILADYLQDLLIENPHLKPDLLIPVAASKQSFFRRKFNQAQVIADILSSRLAISSAQNALFCDKKQMQKNLTIAQRQQNLINAFRLNNKIDLRDKHIALIDDVLTTGLTANTITKLLLAAGAKKVDVYCLARTILH